MGDQGRLQELCTVSMRCPSWRGGSHAEESVGGGRREGRGWSSGSWKLAGRVGRVRAWGLVAQKRTDSPCVPGRTLEGRESGADTMGLFSEKTSLLLVEWEGTAQGGCGDPRKTGPTSWWVSKPAQHPAPRKPPFLLGLSAVSPPSRENPTCEAQAGRCGEQGRQRPREVWMFTFFIKK